MYAHLRDTQPPCQAGTCNRNKEQFLRVENNSLKRYVFKFAKFYETELTIDYYTSVIPLSRVRYQRVRAAAIACLIKLFNEAENVQMCNFSTNTQATSHLLLPRVSKRSRVLLKFNK